MTKQQALDALRSCEPDIRALGVARLAVFGSVLRDEVGYGSDVDILVWFAPGAKTYDRFLILAEFLERLLSRRVDLITAEGLSPFIGPRILAEAQDVYDR